MTIVALNSIDFPHGFSQTISGTIAGRFVIAIITAVAVSYPRLLTSKPPDRDEPSSDIRHCAEAEADTLILDYRVTGPADTEWPPIGERIPLERTPCHHGGSRPWFLCIRCGWRRVVV